MWERFGGKTRVGKKSLSLFSLQFFEVCVVGFNNETSSVPLELKEESVGEKFTVVSSALNENTISLGTRERKIIAMIIILMLCLYIMN